jgi:hypothetical protein
LTQNPSVRLCGEARIQLRLLHFLDPTPIPPDLQNLVGEI